MSSRRLLIVAPTSPLPVYTGGRQRVYHLLRHLAPRHEITFLCFWRDEADRLGLQQLAAELPLGVESLPFARLRSGRHLLAALWHRLRGRWAQSSLGERAMPADLAVWEQAAMHQAINRVLAAKPIDLMQVEWPYMAPYALAHPHRPALLGAIDIFSVALARRAEVAGLAREKRRLLAQSQAWARYEATVFPRLAGVAAMSEADAAHLRQHAPGTRVVVLPNGVDTVALTPGEIRPKVSELLFVGSPNHAPNLDAACWLLEAVWPQLRARQPDLRLTLVNLDHPQVRACQGDGVEITGRLPDLTPIYRRADIALAPLRAGSGTRLKILEAFALGLPVVSTAIGHEGLDVTPGVHLLAADAPEAFSAAILDLIAQKELRQRLAVAARNLVVEHYDWQTIASLYETTYESLLERPYLPGNIP